jgi:protease-4
MSLDADTIVDRRRMRRKLAYWRIFAFLLVVALVAAGVALIRTPGQTLLGSDFIARIEIEGLIRSDHDRVEALDRLGRSSAKAVIVHINSPGGTVAGSDQLYQAVRRLAERKPTVAVVDGLAASGGYIAAIAADHIVALDMSLVGSIGVLFQYPKVGELMKAIGVDVEEVKSTPLKAAPSMFEPTSPEAREMLENLVKDSYVWFRGLVSQRRGIGGALLERAADGRVFTGRQAIDVKLVDQLGNEKTAIAWLAKEKGVDANTPVRDWRLKSRLTDLPFLHLAGALDLVGLGSLARRIEGLSTIQAIERLNLDGLLALWHPASAQ